MKALKHMVFCHAISIFKIKRGGGSHPTNIAFDKMAFAHTKTDGLWLWKFFDIYQFIIKYKK